MHTPKSHAICLVAASLALAAFGALPYAGGWNDGSRLAAVEAIADHGTLAIDDSIFVRVPADAADRGGRPYPADRGDLLQRGTRDKLFISGRFYSDKPYSVSLALAALYRGMQWFGFPRAAERPDLYCWTMTVATSGLAYVSAVWCMYRAGLLIGLSTKWNLLWVISFGFATFAPTYSRHVNSHILMLGVTSAAVLQLARIRADIHGRRWSGPLWLGILAGAAVCLDPGGGLLLLLCLAAYMVLLERRLRPAVILALTSAPFVIVQTGLNYWIGGVLVPVNMVAEYSRWPGSPFNADNLTGWWRHSPVELCVYAASMLFGKRGVVGHNLPLFLLFPAVCRLWRNPSTRALEALTLLTWCAATWLLYAALSNNSSGVCCSIRWFVPFLAPAYFVLALDLKAHVEQRAPFLAASGWGVVMAAIMWWKGPWTFRMVPGYWFFVAGALVTWGIVRARARRNAPQDFLPVQSCPDNRRCPIAGSGA